MTTKPLPFSRSALLALLLSLLLLPCVDVAAAVPQATLRIDLTSVAAPAFDANDPKVPLVDGIVTANAAKTRFAIALVNKHATDAVECDLGLGAIDRTATATLLSGDSPDAFNDIATPDRVAPVTRDIPIRGGRVTIPAHTLLIVSVNR